MKITQEMLSKALSRKIFKWVDDRFREILPDNIYSCAHSGTVEDRQRINNWLAERGYRVESPGDGVVRIMQGTKLVRQTQMILEIDDHEDMLKVAEAVQHRNLPKPPPWHSD